VALRQSGGQAARTITTIRARRTALCTAVAGALTLGCAPRAPDGRPSFYSHENAPGVIMAVGNTGAFLEQAADDMCTWLSRDGGLSWEDVAPYASIYECAPSRRAAHPVAGSCLLRGGADVPARTVTCWGAWVLIAGSALLCTCLRSERRPRLFRQSYCWLQQCSGASVRKRPALLCCSDTRLHPRDLSPGTRRTCTQRANAHVCNGAEPDRAAGTATTAAC